MINRRTMPSTLAAPTNLKGAFDQDRDEVDLQWGRVSGAKLYETESSVGTATKHYRLSEPRLTLEHVGMDMTWRVRAISFAGEAGPWSDYDTIAISEAA
jgi:hypothetical protein